MKGVLIGIIVLLILLIVAAAVLFFVFPGVLPPAMQEAVGLATPAPTATPLGPGTPEPTQDPGKNIFVARFDISENTVITDTNVLLEVRNIPTVQYEGQSDELFEYTQASALIGKVLDVPLNAGEPVQKSLLSDPGLSQRIPTAEPNRPRPKGYPVEVDSLRGVGDQIKAGDTVDVLATFIVPRTIFQPPKPGPALPQATEDGQITFVQPPTEIGAETTNNFFSTKTLIQRAKVLAILRPPPPPPPPPAEGEEPARPPPTRIPGEPGEPGNITGGTWQLVLALNDQQVELIELALHHEAKITLVLRGIGDDTYEPTLGATFDLLFDEFGLPMPQPYDPFVFSGEVLTPEPTRTPAPDIRIP